MYKIIYLCISLCMCLCASSVNAEFYVEAGLFYTQDRTWIKNVNMPRIEESGYIGQFSVGYEKRFDEHWTLDAQFFEHRSDPTQKGEFDLTSKNSIGASVRYSF